MTTMFRVLMHPKPMLRHTKHVVPAVARITAVLPGETSPGQRMSGIYLDLYVGDRHQLLVIDEDQLAELRVAMAAFSTDKE